MIPLRAGVERVGVRAAADGAAVAGHGLARRVGQAHWAAVDQR